MLETEFKVRVFEMGMEQLIAELYFWSKKYGAYVAMQERKAADTAHEHARFVSRRMIQIYNDAIMPTKTGHQNNEDYSY